MAIRIFTASLVLHTARAPADQTALSAASTQGERLVPAKQSSLLSSPLLFFELDWRVTRGVVVAGPAGAVATVLKRVEHVILSKLLKPGRAPTRAHGCTTVRFAAPAGEREQLACSSHPILTLMHALAVCCACAVTQFVAGCNRTTCNTDFASCLATCPSNDLCTGADGVWGPRLIQRLFDSFLLRNHCCGNPCSQDPPPLPSPLLSSSPLHDVA